MTAPRARAVMAIGGAAIAAACASMASPPGGPEDRVAPAVVEILPESGAVNFSRRTVDFRFDEVISDRGTGQAELEQLVVISPRDAPRVSYRRDEIGVRPRSGWRANTTYSVTLLPGVTDLRGNRSDATRATVFSTGGTIDAFAIRGRLFDWLAERPVARARIEAIAADSAVYLAVTDSAGAFVVGPLPAGTYAVKGYIDQNSNRALDRGEAWDSIQAQTARAGVETSVELLAVLRDSVPPRIASVSIADSSTVTVEFDRPLDPRQPINPLTFAVTSSDSTAVPIREALTRAAFDRRVESERARADSIRADTAAQQQQPPPRPQLVRGAQGAARPSVAPPPQAIVLRLARALTAGATYRVTATDVRNVIGRAGTTTRVFQVPRPEPAPRDTTGSRPP